MAPKPAPNLAPAPTKIYKKIKSTGTGTNLFKSTGTGIGTSTVTGTGTSTVPGTGTDIKISHFTRHRHQVPAPKTETGTGTSG